MNDHERIANILNYWFDELNQYGLCSPRQHQLWFQSRADTDSLIEARYGATVAAALDGDLDHWVEPAGGLMALILLLDQFTRNIYRATVAAFSGDHHALTLARNAVASGVDRELPTIHRIFMYIPYEHSEDLVTQEQGVALFDQLLRDCHEQVCAEVDNYRSYALAHRDVIAKFGRFPHRNRILGRDSTPTEQQHLEKHGGF